MALGYTYSGWAKLESATWLDGDIVAVILGTPLSRDNIFCHALGLLPHWCLQVIGYVMLAAELLAEGRHKAGLLLVVLRHFG